MRPGFTSALMVGLLVLAGCVREEESPSPDPASTPTLEREIRGFSLTETHEGKLLWELTAERSWRIPEESKSRLEEVRIRFFDKDGKLSSVLTSRQGEVDEQTEAFTAREAVRVVSAAGDTLDTEEAQYDKEKNEISGPGWVRLAQPDRVLTGTEFEGSPDLSKFKVKRDVHVIIRDDDELVGEP